MKIQMHYVDAKARRLRDTGQRVHVRAVHVDKPTAPVNDLADLSDVLFELTQSVRVGEHQRGHVFVHMTAQFFEIGEPVGSGRHRFNRVAADYRRGRIRSVRGVRYQNLLAWIAPFGSASGCRLV